VQSVAACAELADELPALRCAFRKRCRDGYSTAVRDACSLNVLESELADVRVHAEWAPHASTRTLSTEFT